MIQIIDDVISKTYQDRLENTFLGSNVDWSFNRNLTDASINIGESGFCHNLLTSNYKSDLFDFTLPLVYEISEKSGIKLDSILLSRSFLQLPSIRPIKHDVFHVDLTVDHVVFLYYVNDSDGPTIISNKRYDSKIGQSLGNNTISEAFEKVTPKKGRVVIFNGLFYHAAGIPKKNNRCILNFDLSI